jgi:hypothetical protein
MPPVLHVVHRCALGLLVVDALALGVVDALSWKRTHRIRAGGLPSQAAPSPTTFRRASSTTFLASGCGFTLLLTAITHDGGLRWPAVPLAAVGLLVVVTGWVWRVSGYDSRPNYLVIRCAAAAPWTMAWRDCRELRPPRCFLTGWRMTSSRGGRRSLMPSDVFGNEWVLDAIVQLGGLSFDGRTWVRTERTAVSRPA